MRKLLYLFALASLLLSMRFHSSAQVWNGNLTLNTQSAVDAFNFTEVNGTLTISGFGITNLYGLSELTSCKSLIILSNPSLTNILGLASLEQIDDNFTISNNALLTNLVGLSSLESVTDFFTISNNPQLANLDGLLSFTDIPSLSGRLTIQNNIGLTNVNGLSSVTRLAGLTIKNNPALTNVNGLLNLTRIGFSGLVIDNNDALVNLDGFANCGGTSGDLIINNNLLLLNVDGLHHFLGLSDIDAQHHLEIIHNSSLTNLDGLSSFGGVRDGHAIIQANNLLTNIDGLSHMTLVGHGLNISYNPLLTDVDGLASLEAVNGLNISYNGALTNLDGLAKLVLIINNLTIEYNSSLTDFCGLSNLFTNGEIGGTTRIRNNGANTVSISPPPDIVLNNDPGLCSRDITAVVPTVATVIGCLNPSPPSRSDYPPGNIFPVGTTTIIWTVTDGAGNTATAAQKVIINDNEVPAFTQFPADATVQCAADVSAANTTSVTATDNCPNVVVTHVGDVITNQTCANRYTLTRTYKATDDYGNTTTRSQIITVNDNVAPELTALSPSQATLWPPNHKMLDITLSYTAIDNCATNLNPTITITSNEPENGTGDGDTDSDWEFIDDHHIRLRAERASNGTGRIYTITVTIDDGCNQPVSASTEVRVTHNITAPHSGQSLTIGSTVSFAGEFWDKPGNNHTAKWLIDGNTTAKAAVIEPSGNKNGKVTGTYKFSTPGVYKLQMNVTDQNGITSYANTNGDLEAIIVIYDPNGGHAYGGGYFTSPAGALSADPSATGKASYGFAMNYFKNSTYPKGETQFEFKVGDFEFNALNFDYLVISNSMAQFKGTGKIIGGQSGIGFIMTVTDGELDGSAADKIRMKIYNKNNGSVIYDNQPGASDAALPSQAVGTNSTIVISGINPSLTSANTNQKAEMEASIEKNPKGLDLIVFPNPSASNFIINVNAKTNDRITMQVIDMYGRVIETRNVSANSNIRFGDRYRPGTYFVRIMQGKNHKEIKLIKLSD